MPQLREHVAALRMDGGYDSLPSFDLLVRVETGCSKPPATRERYRGPLGDDEAAVGSSLRVIFEHQTARDVPPAARIVTA
jgi:hypothetical protein